MNIELKICSIQLEVIEVARIYFRDLAAVSLGVLVRSSRGFLMVGPYSATYSLAQRRRTIEAAH